MAFEVGGANFVEGNLLALEHVRVSRAIGVSLKAVLSFFLFLSICGKLRESEKKVGKNNNIILH